MYTAPPMEWPWFIRKTLCFMDMLNDWEVLDDQADKMVPLISQLLIQLPRKVDLKMKI